MWRNSRYLLERNLIDVKRASVVNPRQAESFLAFLGKMAGVVWGGQARHHDALWWLTKVHPVPISGLLGEPGTAGREGVLRNI